MVNASPTAARGYRNRNPGNIDWSAANKWQGQVGKEPGGRFAVFSSHQYGIRALAVLLVTYQDRHGLRTIRDIIARWAPPAENQTSAYVRHVSLITGFGVDQVLDLHTHAHLRPLVEAIITHELSGQPYDQRTLDEGLTMAGVAPPAAVAVRTAPAKAAIGTGAAGGAALALVEVLPAIAPHLGAAADLVRALGPWLAGAIILAVAVYFIAQQRRRQAEIGA